MRISILVVIIAFAFTFYLGNVDSAMSKQSLKSPLAVKLSHSQTSGNIWVKVELVNVTGSKIWIDKSHLCKNNFITAPLLTVKAIKNSKDIGFVGYKGLMINRVDDNSSEHFIEIEAGETKVCEFNLGFFYDIEHDLDEIEIMYSRKNLTYKSIQPEFVMVSKKVFYSVNKVS